MWNESGQLGPVCPRRNHESRERAGQTDKHKHIYSIWSVQLTSVHLVWCNRHFPERTKHLMTSTLKFVLLWPETLIIMYAPNFFSFSLQPFEGWHYCALIWHFYNYAIICISVKFSTKYHMKIKTMCGQFTRQSNGLFLSKWMFFRTDVKIQTEKKAWYI